MIRKKVIVIALLSFVFFGFGFVVHAQSLSPNSPIVDVNFPCPGCERGTTDILTYINNFYRFSLWIGGALALGMIVAGGIMRIISAGSPDKQREASEMITSSIFGLVLLFGSYLILNTINPEITLLKLPAAGEEKVKLTKAGGDSLTASDCVASGVQTFETVRVFDGSAQISSLSCLYRRSVLETQDIQLVEGNYYNDDPVILKNSMVWLYPYFTKQDGPSKPECLIYAYLAPKSGDNLKPEIQWVELNSNLQLCTPKLQSLDSPICKTWTFTAKRSSIEGFDANDPSQYTPMVNAVDTSDQFPYFDPSSPPPLVRTKSDGTRGGPIPGQDDFCYTDYCQEAKWACTISEKPKLDMPSNNVKVEACAANSATEPCVGISDLPGSDSCNKTINNSSLNADGTCKLNPGLVQKLKNFKDKMTGVGINWYITEAWPPKSKHQDPCHANGTCVDIGLGGADCGNVQKALDFLKGSGVGLRPVNEWVACPNTTPKPQKTPFTTGNHIHVEL